MMEEHFRAPWIDNVPLCWRRSRIRNAAVLSPGYSKTPPANDEFCTVVPMELLSDLGAFDASNQQVFEDIQAGLTLFETGDVLFAKITPCMENGKGAFVEWLPTRYGFGSTEFHVLRPLPDADGKFLYYVTCDSVYRAYAAENMTGAAGQKRVSSRFLKDSRLYLPAVREQRLIVSYLDASCAAIDSAVEVKRRQINVLHELKHSIIHHAVTKGLNRASKLRDSHFQWFGEVPEHWQCKHLKRFTSRIQTGVTPPTSIPEYYLDGTVPWFAPGCFSEDLKLEDPKKFINEQAFTDGALRVFPAGTIFWVGIGATIGKVGLISEAASCNQQIIGIVCNHRFLNRFLAYQFKIYESIIPGIAPVTTLPIFDQVKVGYLPVLCPPIEEQRHICSSLDGKLAEMNKTASCILQQIDTLLAYRKSLIHECVTGQRRVTEEDVAKVRGNGADRRFREAS